MSEDTTIGAVLVANRGEIAVRVMRTLRRMGIRSIAVYSEADRDARHVEEADEAVLLGPAPARESYLCIERVLDAAERTGADAIHPGYGFLSENAGFARGCAQRGLVFIGPSVRAIEVMGDKITAKNAVSAFGVPVVPGIARPGLSDAELVAAAEDIGYPVLVKPSAGGGGKGMRLVERPDALAAALTSARREAAAAFGDDTLFLERFVLRPRHIEVQVMADAHGNVVHLGERECSLQRRHQKVIEEAPSPLLDPQTRARIGEAACNTARSVDYRGAGTVEFIVSADRPDEFFFMEMNTRLQVEHPVTEMVTGTDLVEWQVRVAAGEPLGFGQSDVTMTGHAIEARVYAEDPGREFLPTGGTVRSLAEPSGPGVRVDSGLRVGAVVGSDYDPMLAKVIAHGENRDQALARLDEALAGTAVLGTVTNVEFLRFLLSDNDVRAGRLDTRLLDRRLPDFHPAPPSDEAFFAAAAHRWLGRWSAVDARDPWQRPDGWRLGERAPTVFRLSGAGRTAHVFITGSPESATVRLDGGETRALAVSAADEGVTIVVNGLRRVHRVVEHDGLIWVAADTGVWALTVVPEPDPRGEEEGAGEAEITSPMPGSVIAVETVAGEAVAAGAPVVVVEAMKMEHTLTAPVDGVADIYVSVGDQVKVDQLLARIMSPDSEATQNTAAANRGDER